MNEILFCKNCDRPYNFTKHPFKLCPICYRFEMDLISEELNHFPTPEDLKKDLFSTVLNAPFEDLKSSGDIEMKGEINKDENRKAA